MLLGFLALLILVVAFITVRTGGLKAPVTTWCALPTWRTYTIGIGLVIAGNLPLAFVAMPFSGLPALGPGDGRTHAMMARALARGIPHGWTDAYQGGFAVGPHYPSIGWGLSALLIKTGVRAQTAVDTVGLLATLAAPILVFVLAHRMGARFFPSLVGAFFLSWISPTNPVVGGYEAFFTFGLLSQVVAIPFVVCLIAGIAQARTDNAPWEVTLPAVVAMAAHPQITTACIGALLLPVLASRDRALLGRYVRGCAAAIGIGAAIYGPGVATLKVPFGWPPMPPWKTIGFEPSRLSAWLIDGELVDLNRSVPILTTLWAAAIIIVILRIKRPTARAVAIASVLAVVLSVSGAALSGLGSIGVFILKFFQPLRMLTVVPLFGTATVIVAMEEAIPFARHVWDRITKRFPKLGRAPFQFSSHAVQLPVLMIAGAMIVFATTALPARLGWAHESRARIEAYRPDAPCGSATPKGFDQNALTAQLGSLAHGRLWYNQDSKPGPGRPDATAAQACDLATGFDLASSVPVAVTMGMGVQVGVHMIAFHQLHPSRAGSAARAEALGVRHLLLLNDPPAAGEGWAIVYESGEVRLARRKGGTDIVGVGCIGTIWTGSDEALRDRLISDFKTNEGTDRLLDPTSLIALETKPSANNNAGVLERPAAPSECNIAGAEVNEIGREPGAYEANVDAPHPVDVVFRAAAFPTWRIFVDGNPAPTTTIAPGFIATRLPSGKHHVEAVVSTLPWYFGGILLALLCAALLSIPNPRAVAIARRLRDRFAPSKREA